MKHILLRIFDDKSSQFHAIMCNLCEKISEAAQYLTVIILKCNEISNCLQNDINDSQLNDNTM